jgi:NADH-ubiquinone oxidoreductase chain 5
LICGVGDVFLHQVVFYLSVCFVSFVFLLFSGFVSFALGVYFVQSDLIYFVEWNVITLNSSRVVMTLLFD